MNTQRFFFFGLVADFFGGVSFAVFLRDGFVAGFPGFAAGFAGLAAGFA